MGQPKRILSITVKRIEDYDADTSELGQFSTTASEYAIAHVGEHRGEFVDQLPCECEHEMALHIEVDDGYAPCSVADCSCDDFNRAEVNGDSRTLPYFNPNADNYKGEPDADIRKYCLQDYERARTLGETWGYVGVRAEAEVQLTEMSTVQTISSGGLWGIETDSGDDYLREVEGQQLSELKTELRAIGFSTRAISAAMKDVERDK